MADLADMMDALADLSFNAVGGPPTITGKPISVGQGWPLAEDIDKAVRAGSSIVSIYHVPGAGGRPPQVFDFSPGIVREFVPGLTVTVADTSVALTGTSVATETVVLIVDGVGFYSHSSAAPESAATVAAALAAQIIGASSAAGTISIPGSHSIVARIGGESIVGQKIHRQSTQFRIVVWAPNPADRTTIARAIDVAVKREPKFDMPDSSQAIITFEGANMSDREENRGTYRRDLMLTATYDTLSAHMDYQLTCRSEERRVS